MVAAETGAEEDYPSRTGWHLRCAKTKGAKRARTSSPLHPKWFHCRPRRYAPSSSAPSGTHPIDASVACRLQEASVSTMVSTSETGTCASSPFSEYHVVPRSVDVIDAVLQRVRRGRWQPTVGAAAAPAVSVTFFVLVVIVVVAVRSHLGRHAPLHAPQPAAALAARHCRAGPAGGPQSRPTEAGHPARHVCVRARRSHVCRG